MIPVADWVPGAVAGLVAGVVGGLATQIVAYEYGRRRVRSDESLAARRELRAAYEDLRALWDETKGSGVTASEKDNLLAATDVLRQTVRLKSATLHGGVAAEVLVSCVQARRLIEALPRLPNATQSQTVEEAIADILEAIQEPVGAQSPK